MSVRIRLTRTGKKNEGYWRIAVFDSRTRRDGRYLENTGAYDPALAKDRPAAAKKLIASRPTAVNLRWAVERTLRAADPLAEARRIHAEDAAMCEAIARHGAPLLRKKPVLTICNTGALAT